jgi:hypothetical protein
VPEPPRRSARRSRYVPSGSRPRRHRPARRVRPACRRAALQGWVGASVQGYIGRASVPRRQQPVGESQPAAHGRRTMRACTTGMGRPPGTSRGRSVPRCSWSG